MDIDNRGTVEQFNTSGSKEFKLSDSRDAPPVGSVRRLFGLLNRPGLRAPTVKEMTENMAEYIAEDNERIRRGE
jgi:hypothetical protein